jgi:hypothetical protein
MKDEEGREKRRKGGREEEREGGREQQRRQGLWLYPFDLLSRKLLNNSVSIIFISRVT